MSARANPLVSVVIPCYNYGQYLPECLQSIFGQEGGYSFEIIALDDASQDNTLDVLERFKDSRLRVIRHPRNMGHIYTMSEGLAEAQGEFVARIDPDDRYRPYFFSTVIPKLEAYPEVGLAYGDAALIDSRGNNTMPCCDEEHKGKDFKGSEFVRLLFKNFICAPTAMARRQAWLEALPLPPKLAFNDWYFNLMIARRHEFYYVDRVVADYRVHQQNHHVKIIADRSEEPSIVWVLDRVFGLDAAENGAGRQIGRIRPRVYGAQYLTLANKYFVAGMNPDARRCYIEAIRRHPGYLLSAASRRLAATFVSRAAYDRCRGWWRGRMAGMS